MWSAEDRVVRCKHSPVSYDIIIVRRSLLEEARLKEERVMFMLRTLPIIAYKKAQELFLENVITT